jgi:hypothetical protein
METDPAPENPTPENPTPELSAPGLPEHKKRPRGKIARLPPPVREKLNQMLDEGLPYGEVLNRLALDVQDVTEMDVSRWYKNGHQHWLKNQLWLEETRSRLDFALKVIDENEGSSVHQANLHIAATQLIEDLIKRGETLLKTCPQEYIGVVNSISRLSREALQFQRYREACALARVEIAKLREPNRKPSESETLAVVNRLDEILGFK